MQRVAGVVCLCLLGACSFDPSGLDFSDGDGGAPGAGGDARPGLVDAGHGAPDARTGRPDAALPPDANSCDAACPGSCHDNVCVIDCSQVDCSGSVTCPPGFDCEVDCGDDDCSGSVTCGAGVGNCSISCGSGSCNGSVACQADSCTIDCSGFDSCNGSVACGAGTCDVTCFSDSCNGAVDCSGSCGCDVFCIGPSCTGGASCPSQCGNGRNGCTSVPPGCDVCLP